MYEMITDKNELFSENVERCQDTIIHNLSLYLKKIHKPPVSIHMLNTEIKFLKIAFLAKLMKLLF